MFHWHPYLANIKSSPASLFRWAKGPIYKFVDKAMDLQQSDSYLVINMCHFCLDSKLIVLYDPRAERLSQVSTNRFDSSFY